MKDTIVVVVEVLAVLAVCFILLPILIGYAQLSFQKQFRVGAVVDHKPKRSGELYFKDGHLIFRKKAFSIKDIKRIDCYAETVPGLEEICCIDFVLSDGKKILFNGTVESQQRFLDLLFAEYLNIPKIEWHPVLCPFSSEKKVVYEISTQNNKGAEN